ncbi:putative Small GTPase rabd [Balamuthia mandrillaris]
MSDTEQYDSEQNDLLNGSAEEEETHEESAGLDLGEDAQPQHEEEPDLGGDEEEERFSVEDSAIRTEEVNGEEEHETELHNGTEEHKEEEHSSSSEDEQEEKGDEADDFLELEKEKEQVKEKEKKEKLAAPQTPTKNGADKQTPKRPATAPRAAPKGTAQARRVSSSKPATPVKTPSPAKPAGKTVGPAPAGEFSPAVTNKAKKIQRSGNVFDSLYEDAIKRREKRALALQQIEMEKQKAARSPEVSKYAQKTARERNVFEALYADATARREKKEGQTPNASPAKRQQQ